jgi:hypothetical protein
VSTVLRKARSTLTAWAALGALGALGACAPPARPPSATPTLSTVFVTPAYGRTPQGVDLRHESTVGQRAVAATVGQVWSVLPTIFEQLEIETTTLDPAGAIMGNAGYVARRVEGRRLSTYLDCGRSFGREYADSYSVTLGVLVQLDTSADGQTLVRTILDAYARDPSQSGGSVHCITWGSLERRIGELVVEKLGA